MKGSNILDTWEGDRGREREREREGERQGSRLGGRHLVHGQTDIKSICERFSDLAALWAVKSRLELALEDTDYHTLVPLEILEPGLLSYILGGRGRGRGRGRRRGGRERDITIRSSLV